MMADFTFYTHMTNETQLSLLMRKTLPALPLKCGGLCVYLYFGHIYFLLTLLPSRFLKL